MSAYSFSIRIDSDRNVVYLAQEGHAEREDLVRMRDAYARVLRDARPGFVLVHDQRGVESFSDEALQVGLELVTLTNDRGAAAVIRIAPESLASRTRVTRVLASAKPRYRNVRVATPDEAEAALRDLDG
jgi:hypothetical protein